VPPTPSRFTGATLRVLEALLDTAFEDPLYGLELMHRTRLSSGALYPVLMRLEQAGWVESSWQDVGPAVTGIRRRRGYRLTAAGVPAARHVLAGARRAHWVQAREIPST